MLNNKCIHWGNYHSINPIRIPFWGYSFFLFNRGTAKRIFTGRQPMQTQNKRG